MSDLFAIECTTCKTRLRVRDKAVIGQILACPKCSSMVLVQAPPGYAPPKNGDSPASDSKSNGAGHSTIQKQKTASDTPAPQTVAGSPNGKPAPSATPAPVVKTAAGVDPNSLSETVSDSHFDEVESLFGGGPAQKSPVSRPDAKAPAKAEREGAKAQKRRNTPAPPPPAEHGTPPKPAEAAKPADPTPPRVKRLRMAALLTIGGLMGISLALSAAYFVATWLYGARTNEVAEIPVKTGNDEVEVSKDDPVEPRPEPIDKRPTEEVVVPKPDEEPDPEQETTDVAVAKPSGDPLNLVNEKPPVPVDDAANLKKLESQFGKIEADTTTVPGDPEIEESPATSLPEPPDAVERPSSRSRPESRKIDFAARLNDRLVEVEFTGQSLVDVLQFLSDFSTIPITLDPDALPWSKITPATPIHAKLSNATVEEVLAEVLKPPVRLEAVKLEDQIMVTRSSALRKIKCPVDDLTGGDAARQKQLIEMIEALAAPATWKSAGGTGTITPQGADLLIENSELAYGEVLHLCERLRQARGGRPKSVFAPETFALQRRTLRAAPRLDRPLTLNFGQPTQLVKILQRFSEESGARIVIDWQAAGEIGWPPDADAMVTLSKTPLREALTKLLEPMDLTYRVIDANTIQVTTPVAVERKPEIEVYPAADVAVSSDEEAALIERIRSVLGNDAVLRWDAPSKTLLALLSQPKHEALAALLDSSRTTSTSEEDEKQASP